MLLTHLYSMLSLKSVGTQSSVPVIVSSFEEWVSVNSYCHVIVLYLLCKGRQTVQKPVPVIPEERSVNPFETIFSASINANIKLSDSRQIPADHDQQKS